MILIMASPMFPNHPQEMKDSGSLLAELFAKFSGSDEVLDASELKLILNKVFKGSKWRRTLSASGTLRNTYLNLT